MWKMARPGRPSARSAHNRRPRQADGGVSRARPQRPAAGATGALRPAGKGMSRFWPDGLPITVTCDALATPTAFAWADHRHTVAYVTWNIWMNGLYYLPYDVGHQARRTTMSEVRWERYPHIAQHAHARAWLQLQSNLGLARNTVE